MNFYQLPKNLSDLDHFRSNPMVQFKEENVGGVDVVIPCYMIADAEFWKQPMALELRGHVFRKDTGELISAALPKFFNVGENEYTQRHDLPWHESFSIDDKKDGSMITFVIINDKVYAKTKKSFYSDVAIEAQKFIDSAYYQHGIGLMLKQGLSPIYEFFHPEWQIVLNYGDVPKLMYLGYRQMKDVGDGWSHGYWFSTNEKTSKFKSTEWMITTPDEIEAWQKTATDVEGIIIQFNDGRLVKMKTEWYLQQHQVRTEMRERDIAELAALEKLDDVKSIVSEAGLDLSLIEVIEHRVAEEIATISGEVKEIVSQARKAHFPTPKEVAMTYKDHQHFGMIMREWRGQEVNYADWFIKNRLKDYSLKCVYNEKF